MVFKEIQALLIPEVKIITKVLYETRISKDPKIQTSKKFENLTKPPRSINEMKMLRKFHQDRSILKYSKIGEINACDKNKIQFFDRK